ncbi:MAG: glycosyltransferase, partial [Myxococcota bacterium]
MKFSIITAVLNNRETISDCIESVASQSYKFIEHIIIDGLSTDGTIDIIKDYSSRYSHIRWISEKDNGIYNAINKGIKISTGEIIGILNSDDIFDNKEVLGKIAKAFQDYNVDSC